MGSQQYLPGASGSSVDMSDGVVTASGGFVGAVTGNADTATEAANAGDKVLTAVLALGASGAGVATKALTLTLKRLDGSTAITTPRVALIRTCAGADAGDPLAVGVSTVSFGTATAGSIIASGAGWAVVLTSASGAFACTCTDSADETIVAWAETSALSDTLAHSCLILPSAMVQATWA